MDSRISQPHCLYWFKNSFTLSTSVLLGIGVWCIVFACQNYFLGGINIHKFVEIMGQNIVHIKGDGKQTVVIQTGMTCSFMIGFYYRKAFRALYSFSYHRPGYGVI